RISYSAFSLVVASRPAPLSEFVGVYFNWLYVLGFIRQRVAPDVTLLLDQGLAQAAWSTAYRAREQIYTRYRSFLSQVQSEFGVEVVAVYKDADWQTIQHRLQSRADNRSPLDRGRGGDG